MKKCSLDEHMILNKTFENRAKLLNSNFGVLYYARVLGDMVIFHIVISPACEITDTQYYHAWVGGGKKETPCTCHRLFS